MDNRTPYKTAAELRIEQWEHDGLVALIGPLSRSDVGGRFDMAEAYRSWSFGGPTYTFPHRKTECGSVGCIGGYLAVRANLADPQDYVNESKDLALGPLFFPQEDSDGWDATAPQAARAIVNFLVTGDPQWDAVMAEAA